MTDYSLQGRIALWCRVLTRGVQCVLKWRGFSGDGTAIILSALRAVQDEKVEISLEKQCTPHIAQKHDGARVPRKTQSSGIPVSPASTAWRS